MEYKDTPNERILNLFTGLEGFLVNYIATNPKDKEEAAKYLGYIRKGIEEKYEDLPAPPESKIKKIEKVEAIPAPAVYNPPIGWHNPTEPTFQWGMTQAQAAGQWQQQQAAAGQAGAAGQPGQQVQDPNDIWGFWRR